MEPIEHVAEFALGVETSVNDPFLVTRGARATVAVRPASWVGVVATFGYAPNLGEAAYTRRTRQIIEQNAVFPAISVTGPTATQSLELTPIRAAAGPVLTALHVNTGLALVGTVDDVELLSQESTDFVRELHLGWSLGVAADAWRGPIGLRLSATRLAYEERFGDDELSRAPVLVGAAFGFRG